MSYLWMVIIILGWFIWALLAIAEVYDNADGDYTVRGIIDSISKSDRFIAWISTTIFVLFFASLFLFLIGRFKAI